MISAGDHERLPKRKKDGEEDLKKKAKEFKPMEVDPKLLKKLRKGVKKKGNFKSLGEYDKDVVFRESENSIVKNNPSPIKGMDSMDDMRALVAMAKQGRTLKADGNILGNPKKRIKR